MKVKNAVTWHSSIATEFDKKYEDKPNFIERYTVWKYYIDKYSDSGNCVLDVGCGSGVFSFYLAKKNRKVIAMDASDEMLEICKAKKKRHASKNVEILKCDINRLCDFVSIRSSLIVCSSVLEYLEDMQSVIDSFSLLLEKGGILLFSIPNKSSIYRKMESVAYRITGYPKYYRYVKNVCTLAEVSDLLKKHGYIPMEHEYFGSTPLLSKIFSKFGLSKYSDNLLLIAAQKAN